MHTDTLHRFYRWWFAVLSVGQAGIGLLLAFWPASLMAYWPWPLTEPRAAMLLSAGYLSGAAYTSMAWQSNSWDAVRLSVGGLMALYLGLALAPGWAGFGWLFIHLFVVAVTAGFLAWQMRQNAGAYVGDADMEPNWRRGLLIHGTVYAGIALFGFLIANFATERWPWPAQPVDVRVFAAQLLALSWGGLLLWRPPAQWRHQYLGMIFMGTLGFFHLSSLFTPSVLTLAWNAAPVIYERGQIIGWILPLLFGEWLILALVAFTAQRD